MALKKNDSYDVILCGKQAIDGDTAQVGPGIAAHLDIPQITYVKHIQEIEEGKIVAQRMTEDGYDVVSSSLPCLLTVVKEINDPRLPSLKGKMRSKKIEIQVVTNEQLELDADHDLGLNGSPTVVSKIFAPEVRNDGEMLEGEPHEIAKKLAIILKEVK